MPSTHITTSNHHHTSSLTRLSRLPLSRRRAVLLLTTLEHRRSPQQQQHRAHYITSIRVLIICLTRRALSHAPRTQPRTAPIATVPGRIALGASGKPPKPGPFGAVEGIGPLRAARPSVVDGRTRSRSATAPCRGLGRGGSLGGWKVLSAVKDE